MKDRKDRKISVAYGRTYNTGQYSSMRIDASEEFTLPNSTVGETNAARKELFAILKAQVENELRKMETPEEE